MIATGIFIAGVVQTLLVAFGLGQLMQTLPMLAYGVKVVGAVYLAWVGIKILKSWYENLSHSQSNTVSSVNTDTLRAQDLIVKGLLNNLLNPKALLFFSLFLPQFTQGTQDISSQILILGMLLSSFALMANLFFAFSFSTLASLFKGFNKNRAVQQSKPINLGVHIEGFLGLIFIGLAVRLASAK